MILLDTHAWIWWIASPEQLSRPARERIDKAADEHQVHVSSISTWEVAMLVKKGRLELSMDVEEWGAKSESLPFLHFVPMDNRIAILSNQLADGLHEDPADRIITATALVLGMPLVTRDQKLRDYPHIETLW